MNAERLLTLADHLESDKRGHKIFDFRIITDSLKQENGCGTAGCALGEMPLAFPDLVEWRGQKWGVLPGLIGNESITDSFQIAEHLFSITSEESGLLFAPSEESAGGPQSFGGEFLGSDATPKQVAANIRAFVAHKQAIKG